MKHRPLPILVDNSLSLVNRTGAYYLAKDLCAALPPEKADIRYWRLGKTAPAGLARKVLARLMMLEIGWLGDNSLLRIREVRGAHRFRLFLDPLYVLRSELDAGDIVLCHDIGPLTHSHLYDPKTVESYRRAYARISRVRPGIVCVSDWTRRHFEARFSAGYRFLKTIPLYVRPELFKGPAEPVSGIGEQFFLTVGAFETRKNQMAALRAFQAGGFHSRGIQYVLCGARGKGHEEIFNLARDIPGVIIPGYVPDAQLRWLYAEAEAFVLPSLLEGFGMPALEAAYMGLLPIVSQDSALVEAANDICLKVDPADISSISTAMSRAVSRTREEKSATRHLLRVASSVATKERYLRDWMRLLDAETSETSSGIELADAHDCPARGKRRGKSSPS